jgi:uncharacterized protein YuzE
MNDGTQARYDPEADALAIRFPRFGKPYAESEEVAPGVILDFDSEGRVIGVQLLEVQDLLATGVRTGPVKEPAV